MIKVDTCEFENEIVADLAVELSTDPNYNEEILKRKVKNAVKEVMLKRNYVATSWNDEQILDDLQNYYSIIRNVSLYDYNQVGVEFTTNISENYSRTYANRDDLFKGLHAFVGCL